MYSSKRSGYRAEPLLDLPCFPISLGHQGSRINLLPSSPQGTLEHLRNSLLPLLLLDQQPSLHDSSPHHPVRKPVFGPERNDCLCYFLSALSLLAVLMDPSSKGQSMTQAIGVRQLPG